MDDNSNNDVLFTQDHVLREGQIPPVRRFKNIAGRRNGYKKAYVRLVTGQSIDFTGGTAK